MILSRMGVKTKDWLHAQRNFVIDLFKQGKTFRMMQEATGMALGTISNLIIKYKRFGYVKNYPRSGLKSKMAPRIDRQIDKMVQEN